MTLTLQQWKEILDAINSSDVDILEQIKEKLREKHEDEYQEWGEKDFDVNHRFDVSLIANKELYHGKLALLWIAASNGHLNIVKYLVDDKKVSLDQKSYGVVALCWAAARDHLGIVKYLVDDKKVSPDQIDNRGRTALHMAASNGHLDIVKYLIDDKKVSSLDRRARNGNTALHMAASNGHLDIVKYLISKGANRDIKNERDETPIDLANRYKHYDVVAILQENSYIKNKHDETPIDLAEAETKQIISKAIKTGATLSIITALTVGVGCGIAGVGLPILVIASIAASAALVIGLAAAGITYSVLKPSDKLDKPGLKAANQQVPERA